MTLLAIDVLVDRLFCWRGCAKAMDRSPRILQAAEILRGYNTNG